MGGGYGGLESYLRWSRETDELKELQNSSIEELSQLLEQSGNKTRGGDTMSAIVQREEERSRLIIQVLRKKLIDELCHYTYTENDGSQYSTKDLEELKEEWRARCDEGFLGEF